FPYCMPLDSGTEALHCEVICRALLVLVIGKIIASFQVPTITRQLVDVVALECAQRLFSPFVQALVGCFVRFEHGAHFVDVHAGLLSESPRTPTILGAKSESL